MAKDKSIPEDTVVEDTDSGEETPATETQAPFNPGNHAF